MIQRKRFAATLLLLVCIMQTALAIPADPTPRKYRQADGTEITLVKTGDEHGYMYVTEDGYPVLFNPSTGNYEYAVLSRGLVVMSGRVARDANMRPANDAAFLKNQSPQAILRQNHLSFTASPRRLALTRQAPHRVRISDYPTIGHHRALVILVEFNDEGFSTTDGDTYGYYNGMLNENGFTYRNGAHGSAHDFYTACSDSLFDPQFDVIGPVRLPQPAAYYGGDRIYTQNGQNYRDIDTCMAQFVTDACLAADSLVDYSQYDEDHDGRVDNIYFFFAGYGEADSNIADAIWPHSATLDGDWGTDLTLDGVRISRYTCSNEIRNGSSPLAPVGIGTFVHEFGHVLGLADHYDTSYSSGRTGVSQWDVMAAASYNDNQNTPPAFNAFERAELGWLNYDELAPDSQGVIKAADLITTNKAYRVTVPGTGGNEYFVIENRQATAWDSSLPAHGILVWHVDMDSAVWMSNTVNVDPHHQHLDLVEADGTENATSLSGDPFPGRRNVRRFDFTDWNGDTLFSFDDVNETDTTINFMLARTGFVPEAPSPKVLEVHGTSLTMTWAPVNDAYRYQLTVSQISTDGDTTIVRDYDKRSYPAADTVTIGSLQPLTHYTISMQTVIGNAVSPVATTDTTTTELEFTESKPVATNPTNVTSTGFTAHWQPLSGAQAYSVTLYQGDYDIAASESYDFTSRADSLPSAWSTSSTRYSVALYGEKAPSLQLNNDSDYLMLSYPEARISSITFWALSQNTHNVLHLEKRTANGWLDLEQLTPASQGSVYSFDVDTCSIMRLRFERAGGYILLDDVSVGLQRLSHTPVSGYEQLNAGNATELAIAGLAPGRTYGYRVRGLRGSEQSSESNEVSVSLGVTDGIVISPTENGKAEYYDLSGCKLSRAARGVVIVRKEGYGRKTIIK